MIQTDFAENAKNILQEDPNVIGLAVGGSWLTAELDEYSDLDLILITTQPVARSKDDMMAHAQKLGKLLNGFTGEHVGEPRLLICLYDEPLLHVDIKFLTLDEFSQRVEDPHLLIDKGGQLQQVIDENKADFPMPDFQWIEDRFWTWIHYALLKTGRGEYMEALDFLSYLRMVVLGPLLHLSKGQLPRGMRKLEMTLSPAEMTSLSETVPTYDRSSILKSLKAAVGLYRNLRSAVYSSGVTLASTTEQRVMDYMLVIEQQAD